VTQARRAAVLGSPIAHSLSPVLHRAAYAALGLHDWTYTAIECDEAGLPGLLASCDRQWAGLSLTMPLKRAVLPLLDRTEPLAVEVGGANTVVFENGERHGYNTNVPGMVAALAEAGVTAPPRATILGAGATACAALAALRETGLTSAVVLVRDQARAGDLLAAAGRLGMAVELRPFDTGVRDGELLVSTVPAGAADFMPNGSGLTALAPAAVLDVVYNPWPTPLARAAATSGVVVSGFDLLLQRPPDPPCPTAPRPHAAPSRSLVRPTAPADTTPAADKKIILDKNFCRMRDLPNDRCGSDRRSGRGGGRAGTGAGADAGSADRTEIGGHAGRRHRLASAEGQLSPADAGATWAGRAGGGTPQGQRDRTATPGGGGLLRDLAVGPGGRGPRPGPGT